MQKNHEDPPRTNHKIWQHAQFSTLICSSQNNWKDAEIVKIKQVKRESCATLLNLIAHTETVPGFFRAINLSAILKVHHHCLSLRQFYLMENNALKLIPHTLHYYTPEGTISRGRAVQSGLVVFLESGLRCNY